MQIVLILNDFKSIFIFIVIQNHLKNFILDKGPIL